MNASKTGVLFFTEAMSTPALIDYAKRMEEMDFTLWLPELFGREPFSTAGFVLANTSTLQVATAIANVYVRDATSMAQTRRSLANLSEGRFGLGLGVSNAGLNQARGHEWTPPLPKLRSYLDEMEQATVQLPETAEAAPLYLAAHGPKLRELAGQRADGVLTYLMVPEHTKLTRETLGPDKAISIVIFGLLCEDPDEARRLARKSVKTYMSLDYYHREWRQYGFTDEDFANGGSDRLIDTLVAWGSPEQIRARIGEHRQAGASHVIVIPLNPAGGGREPHWPLLDALAEA
ncbi:MAG: TIGR03620 family F420-dependent LLM class oxidoreductase [Pseudomonadota bacterium]